MSLVLTFKTVSETIKKHGKDDPKLIDAVDKLLGFALICSPVVLEADAAALLPTLAVKNELVRIGKSVFDKFTKKQDEDYFTRHETMRTAYGLLVFTSFFDALDSRLPETLRKEIALLDCEKALIAKDAAKRTPTENQSLPTCDIDEAPISAVPVLFPHPTETLTEQTKRQSQLWKQMGQGFVEFVHKLAFWDDADEKKRASLLKGLEDIEDEAAKRFEAQYFELCRKHEDFAVWANLHAQSSAKALIGDLSEYVKQHATLSAATESVIDVGFSKLRETVLRIPEVLRIEQAADIANSFDKHYQARINDPIIEDKDATEDNIPKLAFPKVCDAFVPQAFRVLRQGSSKSRRLEDESTWNALPRRNDLGAFLLSYLSSPYSAETPLLILGHPGSGKSLLTTVLSARLMSRHFTAIRVPLREVNADADIQTQIEEYVRRISGVGVDSWIKLRSLFKNCPPLIILDGYDELLQASGQVFASYIMDAQRFQQHQAEQGWPVRIIITSRVTLIDKAAIPTGSTIVRLLEFDQHQRDRWIRIWNLANTAYFRECQIDKFALPSADERGAEKILNLAEQPLLLLMLALYDSQQNQLRASQGLDRTKLYDSLLRRFVLRERSKEKGFNDTKSKEREKALSTEMQRLGVAALGMYNRRKVHILSAELDDDLAFFRLERDVPGKSGKGLTQADLLLGSFFFVHKSKAQHSSGARDTHEESSAFEFLHNTFGEFLTADFVVRRAMSQVQTLRAAESSDALRSVLDKMMGTADGFERDWFASLVYTPLFTRPVIMEMIREWTPHVLQDIGLLEKDFVETLDKIVLNQIKRLLNKREMPQIMRKETAQEGYRVPFGDHPLIGHMALYSINLILLRVVSGRAPFLFDEGQVASHEDGARPWDRLIELWRSWFSLGNLNGLSSVMLADRKESTIVVTAKNRFQAEDGKGKLQELYNVAVSLGDDVSAGISGLYLLDPNSEPVQSFEQLERKLESERLELGVPASIAKLIALGRTLNKSKPQEFMTHARESLEKALANGRPDQLEAVCQVIVRALENGTARMRELIDPRLAAEVAGCDPRSGRILFEFRRSTRDDEWLFEFFYRFLDVVSQKVPPLEDEDPGSGNLIEWLRLLRDMGRGGGLNRFHDRRKIHSRFLDRLLDPGFLSVLSERNPEVALIYLQILKAIGGWRHLNELRGRIVDTEFLERMFHPKRLFELTERNPETGLLYLQLLKEISGERYSEKFVERRHYKPFVRILFNRHNWMELIQRNPTVAVAYLQVFKELRGVGSLERLFERARDPKVFGRTFHPRYILDMIERRPEAALTYLQIQRDLGETHLFEVSLGSPVDRELFDRLLHPGYMLELSEMNPESVSLYARILREFVALYVAGPRVHQLDHEIVERMLQPRYLLGLTARNPEAALVYAQMLSSLGGGGFPWNAIPRHDQEIDHLFEEEAMRDLIQARIESLAVWLVLVRVFPTESAIKRVHSVVVRCLKESPGFRIRLECLPIASLVDMRWLAERTDSREVKSLVTELVDGQKQ